MPRVHLISLFLLLLPALPASADIYAQQAAVSPPPYATGGDPYVPQPYYPTQITPAVPHNTPQPAPAQTQPGYQPRPGEYGTSVMTDIRQMNF